jgi:hypothetical protein
MPSERPKYGMGKDEFEWVGRAEKRYVLSSSFLSPRRANSLLLFQLPSPQPERNLRLRSTRRRNERLRRCALQPQLVLDRSAVLYLRPYPAVRLFRRAREGG